ncbi:type VI secretion system tip protein VgrG [Vibrio cholerae]|uniref:Type VI secretion system tip protein VgrG n=1 Tax=Vibrio cholerae TaxID=666 RepID=A0A5Q6PCV0_VIBCL|nr:type VI secretion system tip protein VgrG [Vibrio cholerae]EJK2991464.1 type VI secretion system tip protein VgrG [Vibrio cholerae]EJL6492015.1 type VI secretion system tip protein VgrG [Vibrio cholerae]EJL6643754.1 type VI secretion system tip protein VgrG [Vibrio cholerae]EJL6904401.1 type VI secretion system tip protein VgrG [Vibrio cholerae]EKF9153547.1 type VI secretion system tip protein VgrG [Vibrio cholerae]
MATLAYTIHIDGLGDETLVVTSFEGQESLSNTVFQYAPCYGFRYEIALASRQPHLSAAQVVDKSAELRMFRDGQLVQRVHGIVRAFSQGDIGHHYTLYSLTLVPALERLSLRHNSRIFQRKTVPEILSVILQEMGINDYAFALERECEQREFCVQYRETDLDFLHRLAAEEGLVYCFTHEAGKHTLLFSDSSATLNKLAEPIPYNALAGGTQDTPYISGLTSRTETQVSDVELKDYSFKKPNYSFLQRTQGEEMAYQQAIYSHFDAPGRYKDDLNGKAFSQVRLEYLRREAHTGSGKSNQPLLRAGYKFTLQDHLNTAMNRDWLLISVHHHGTQPQAMEEEGGSGATTYANQFTVIPAHLNWQATPQPKPLVDGPMIATVVGPKGEEIFCDEYGRVKVHFHWDRYSNGDEQSSCWVRVSQGWAGSQYGMITIPRIGHEVIVSFLNGDPDQPIITGRTYHATNTPPYPLPENKTKTVLRSDTHQGEGFNELSFEDQAGKELIYLHAQKDMQVKVENSSHSRINYDQSVSIGHDEMHVVANDRKLTVDGSQSQVTKGNYVSDTQGDKHESIGGDLARRIAGAIGVSADGDITIKSGSKITLQVGGSFVVIDASGVAIDGGTILIKSGGSPGSLALPSSADVLEAAASAGSAFVANCPEMS